MVLSAKSRENTCIEKREFREMNEKIAPGSRCSGELTQGRDGAGYLPRGQGALLIFCDIYTLAGLQRVR